MLNLDYVKSFDYRNASLDEIKELISSASKNEITADLMTLYILKGIDEHERYKEFIDCADMTFGEWIEKEHNTTYSTFLKKCALLDKYGEINYCRYGFVILKKITNETLHPECALEKLTTEYEAKGFVSKQSLKNIISECVRLKNLEERAEREREAEAAGDPDYDTTDAEIQPEDEYDRTTARGRREERILVEKFDISLSELISNLSEHLNDLGNINVDVKITYKV